MRCFVYCLNTVYSGGKILMKKSITITILNRISIAFIFTMLAVFSTLIYCTSVPCDLQTKNAESSSNAMYQLSGSKYENDSVVIKINLMNTGQHLSSTRFFTSDADHLMIANKQVVFVQFRNSCL